MKFQILLTLLLLASCAHSLKFEPTPLKGQVSKYKNGQRLIHSKGRISKVTLSCTNSVVKSSERLSCAIGVENISSRSFSFDTKNINVALDKEPLAVISYREMHEEVLSNMKWRELAEAVQNANGAIGADQMGLDSNEDNKADLEKYEYVAIAKTYHKRISRKIASEESSELSEIKDYIQMSSIKPRSSIVGTFKVASIKSAANKTQTNNTPLKLIVTIGADKHVFSINKKLIK